MGNNYLDDMLEHLVVVIPEWESFGLHLGIPFEKINLINADNLTAKLCMRRVIEAWIQQYGTKATFDKVIAACKRIGNFALAEELEKDGLKG